MKAIDNIREDKTWCITYGYMVICVAAIINGGVLVYLGGERNAILGVGVGLMAIVGLVMWTGADIHLKYWWRRR
jgi:hypothetical protein